MLENPHNVSGITAEAVANSIAQLSEQIPDTIELGLHICYGDRDHHHFIKAKICGTAVAFANRLFGLIERADRLGPHAGTKDRDDEAYFAPLQNLRLPPRHAALSRPRTSRRRRCGRDAADDGHRHFVKGYGIATECGLGRQQARRSGRARPSPRCRNTRYIRKRGDHDRLPLAERSEPQSRRCGADAAARRDLRGINVLERTDRAQPGPIAAACSTVIIAARS